MALIMNNKYVKTWFNKRRLGLKAKMVYICLAFSMPLVSINLSTGKSPLSFSNKKSFQRLNRLKSLMCSFNQSQVREHLK